MASRKLKAQQKLQALWQESAGPPCFNHKMTRYGGYSQGNSSADYHKAGITHCF
jgi:hypothetical protein